MPVRFNNVQPDDIRIQEPFKIKMGVLAKFDPLAIQLPGMNVPYTCTPMPPMSGMGEYKCKLALSFNDQPPAMQGEHKALFDMMQDIDTKAIAYIKTNIKRFFPNKKPPSVELLETELFHRSVRITDDYHPVFQAKVDFEETEPAISADGMEHTVGDGEHSFNLKVSCYNKAGASMPAELALAKRNKVVAIASPEYIWCISGRCGITWKIPRCVVTELAADESAFDFDLTEEDTGESESME
tara:strand:- start:4498 stop:5220 length:723 start_codon:yes stop_codon:yes gene_type:complete